MAARVRPQPAAPVATPSRVSSGGAAPPAYQPTTFPLTPAAQRSLAGLLQSHPLKHLDEHILEAQAAVTVSAGEINDRLTTKEKNPKKRKNKDDNDEMEEAGGEDAERTLEELRDKVERMTQRMEESMRKLIDGQHSVQHIKESVGSTSTHARAHASTQASTQSRTQRRRAAGDEEDGEDEDYQEFEPTDPAAGTQAVPSAIEKFRQDMDAAKTRYQSHSMTARYAENNAYVGFRRIVHDAQHHDDGVPLADHQDWFPEGERPAPGVMTRRARANEDDGADSDDDIAVSKMTISTKCPLTLQEFKNPLTSTKCPHNFESDAIMQMIDQSRPQPVDGGRPQKAVQCPVSGCSQLLTKNDLRVDNVLIRKIKRVQEAARLAEEESDEDDDGQLRTQRDATLIDDDEDGADVDDVVTGRVKRTQVKGEMPRSSRTAGRPSQHGAGGGMVDLAADSSDEAEEGEDEDMDE